MANMISKMLYFEKSISLQELVKKELESWEYQVECESDENIFLTKFKTQTYEHIFIHALPTDIYRWGMISSSQNTQVLKIYGASKTEVEQQIKEYVINSPKARKDYILKNVLWYDCDTELGKRYSSEAASRFNCAVSLMANMDNFMSSAKTGNYDFGIVFDEMPILKQILPDLEKTVTTGYYLRPPTLKIRLFSKAIDYMYRRYKLYGPKIILEEKFRLLSGG